MKYENKTKKVWLLENHDEALYVWKKQKIKECILIHIDAHHDLYGSWNIKKKKGCSIPINIGNYLFEAIDKKIVRKIIWVVPDQTFFDTEGINKTLKKLMTIDGADGFNVSESNILSGKVNGIELIVCTLTNIPITNDKVLLDIDIDFLLIKDSNNLRSGNFEKKPWISPNELIEKINKLDLELELTTIAYSVNGGYTPLHWKHLGLEIKKLIDGEDVQWTQNLVRAAEYVDATFYEMALEECILAENIAPNEAAIQYFFCRINIGLGNYTNAREHFKKAVKLDKTYKTPFGVSGWALLDFNELEKANLSFVYSLKMNPMEPYYLLGLGIYHLRKKNLDYAEFILKKALRSDPTIIECYRELGDLYIMKNMHKEGIKMYKKSMHLVDMGYKLKTDPNAIGIDKTSRNRNWDFGGDTIIMKLSDAKLAVLKKRKSTITEKVLNSIDSICSSIGFVTYIISRSMIIKLLRDQEDDSEIFGKSLCCSNKSLVNTNFIDSTINANQKKGKNDKNLLVWG